MHDPPLDPPLEPPFDRLGRLAVRVLDVPLVFVAMVGAGSPFLTVAPGRAFPELGALETAAGSEFGRRLAESGIELAIGDVRLDQRTADSGWLLTMGLASLACSPLLGPHGEVLGTLCVADVSPRAWTGDHLELLAAFAATAASKAALRGAIRRSDETAALLQHSMLTDLPDVARLELVARYVPAQDSAQVGGDWYDAFVLPDGVTALVVGDVAGHDMPAAAKMGQLRNLLRGIGWYGNAAPHLVLSALDTTMYGLGVAELATVVYARIEETAAGDWQVRWANAGHPPPLLVTAQGEAWFLDQPAGVLLAFGDAEHTDGVAVLPPSATLLLYTDGLIESRIMDIDGGLERLRAAAAAAADWPLDKLCDRIVEELAGGINEDDVTLLAVRIPE